MLSGFSAKPGKIGGLGGGRRLAHASLVAFTEEGKSLRRGKDVPRFKHHKKIRTGSSGRRHRAARQEVRSGHGGFVFADGGPFP